MKNKKMISNNSNPRAASVAPETPAVAIPTPAAIRGMQPQNLFYSELQTLLTANDFPLVLKTLPEVARAFGVGAATVRINWRQEGMPGLNGNYDVAEILIWRIARDANNAGRTVHQI